MNRSSTKCSSGAQISVLGQHPFPSNLCLSLFPWAKFRTAKGTIFVFDRGYNDYALLGKIKEAGHHFVIRMKKNTHILRILGQQRTACGKGVLADETVAFALPEAEERYPDDLRLVTYHDEEHMLRLQDSHQGAYLEFMRLVDPNFRASNW